MSKTKIAKLVFRSWYHSTHLNIREIFWGQVTFYVSVFVVLGFAIYGDWTVLNTFLSLAFVPAMVEESYGFFAWNSRKNCCKN